MNIIINGINTNTHETVSYPFLHKILIIHVHTNTYNILMKNTLVVNDCELLQNCVPTQYLTPDPIFCNAIRIMTVIDNVK